MRKFVGYAILLMICINTISIWLLGKDDLSLLYKQPLASLSEIFGLLGFILMSMSILFSTKFSILEDIFGGLDKNYFVHHVMGSLSFIFLLNHPLMNVLSVLPLYPLAAIYLFPGNDWTYNLGIFALYIMLFSFLFIAFVKIGYKKWLWFHRLLVVSFLLGVVHAFLMSGDIQNNVYLDLWIAVFGGMGLFCSLYILFLYPYFGTRFLYSVDTINRVGKTFEIYMSPLGRRIRYQAGQFIYVKFISSFLGREIHPFSFSSAPWENQIRVTAKELGDFTKKLSSLKTGDRVEVFGPHGRFGDVFLSGRDDVIFVAGGIGITPFLSMLRYESVYPQKRKIRFVYSYKSDEESYFFDEIHQMDSYLPQLSVLPWPSHQKGRLGTKDIEQFAGLLKQYHILLCGPKPMMMSLKKQFMVRGVPENQIIYEDFAFL